jgi:hypothetical protein
MSDLFSKFDALIEQRETLLSTGLTDPFNLVMERVESPTVAICNGKRTILLGTYNYMGMTFDPDVVAAGKIALEEFGSGTTGSRVLTAPIRPQRMRGGAQGLLRHGPCHGLLNRLPGQTSASFRRSPARMTTSSSTSTAMHPSTTAVRSAMRRSSPSATMTSTLSKND